MAFTNFNTKFVIAKYFKRKFRFVVAHNFNTKFVIAKFNKLGY